MLKAPLLFLGHTFLVIQNRPNNGICPIKKVNNPKVDVIIGPTVAL